MDVYENIITEHSPLWSYFGGKKPDNGKKVSSVPSARRFMMGLYHDYINQKDSATSGERLDKIFPIIFETADTRDVKIFIDIFDELKIGHLLSNSKKKYKGEA